MARTAWAWPGRRPGGARDGGAARARGAARYVSVSFRTVEVDARPQRDQADQSSVNTGTGPVSYAVAYEPITETPGVELRAQPESSLNIPAGGSRPRGGHA